MDILEEAKILYEETGQGMGYTGRRIFLELIKEVELLRAKKAGAEIVAKYEENQHLKIADAIDILTR